MTKLEELLKELCPNGVEFVALQKVVDLHKGVQFNRKDMGKTGAYPVINGGIEPSGFIEQFNERENTITISQGGASAGYVNWQTTKFWAGAHCYVIRPWKDQVLNNRYLYHFIKSKEKELQACQYGAGIPALGKDTIMNLQIPLPPIGVQSEIVRILDDFTLLSSELAAELAARLKQYEYYRDKLLSFDKLNGGGCDVRRVKLKEIATEFYRGSGITREQVYLSGTPCVRYGEIYTTYHTWFDKCQSYTNAEEIPNPKYFEYGDILFAITGENVEDIAKSVAYVGHEKCLAGGDIVVMKHNQNPKYLAYALSTYDAVQQKGKGKIKSKVVHSNVPSIENIEIFLPPLEIQERMVYVLDHFDAICNDLGIGLPAEIEKRQKQYEFYRDKLLTSPMGSDYNPNRQTDRQG